MKLNANKLHFPTPAIKPGESWDEIQQAGEAERLIQVVTEETTKAARDLFEKDESSADRLPGKGKVALVNHETEVPGLGFGNKRIESQDALLKYDPKTGEIEEAHTKVMNENGMFQSFSVHREEDKTVFTTEGMGFKILVTVDPEGKAEMFQEIEMPPAEDSGDAVGAAMMEPELEGYDFEEQDTAAAPNAILMMSDHQVRF